MQIKRLAAAAVLVLAGVTSANATLVNLTPSSYGQWQTFDVADPLLGLGNNDLSWIDVNNGSNLSFTFTIAQGQVGKLTIVDAGFSGDRFSVSSNGSALGLTSAAINSYPTSTGDFDLALSDTSYSRGLFTFATGTYTVSGALDTSALDNTNSPLNATVGGLRVDVSPVPLPAAALLLLNGLGVFGFAARRRAAR